MQVPYTGSAAWQTDPGVRCYPEDFGEGLQLWAAYYWNWTYSARDRTCGISSSAGAFSGCSRKGGRTGSGACSDRSGNGVSKCVDSRATSRPEREYNVQRSFCVWDLRETTVISGAVRHCFSGGDSSTSTKIAQRRLRDCRCAFGYHGPSQEQAGEEASRMLPLYK